MLSRDDFQFVLAPWEHRGAIFDARPDAVAQLELDGQVRTFLLKVKRNMLWFREAERDDEWVFAVMAPLETDSEKAEFWRNESEFLAAWFENELRSGNFGRAVVWDDFQNYEGNFILLFAADGRGIAREPWDNEGLSFEWPAYKELNPPEALDWPFETFQNAARELDKNWKLGVKFGEREPPRQVLDGEELYWLCGSREELEQLTIWMAHVAAGMDEFWAQNGLPKICFRYRSENQYGRAQLAWLEWPQVRWQAQDEEIPSSLCHLADLFLDFHTPVGHEWEFQDAMGGRDSWEPDGLNISFDVSAPTAHEKLEAHRILRDWLRGKVPDEQISVLLQT